MAYTVVWTHIAVADLRLTIEYIDQDDPVAAEALALKVLARVDAAAAFPLAGRIVPEIGDEQLREAILNPYRIVYHVDAWAERMTILRIWHTARGVPHLDPKVT